MTTFVEWLESEIAKRGWRPADLARLAGVTDATISHILNQNRQAGPEACLAIAYALKEPPEKVFRVAGLLPPLPGPEDDQLLLDALEVMRQLSPDERRGVLEYVRWRYRQQQEK